VQHSKGSSIYVLLVIVKCLQQEMYDHGKVKCNQQKFGIVL